jgi:hypothetical protein
MDIQAILVYLVEMATKGEEVTWDQWDQKERRGKRGKGENLSLPSFQFVVMINISLLMAMLCRV